MNKKKVLFTGAGGLLGGNLVLSFNRSFRVAATYYPHLLSPPDVLTFRLDITRPDDVWGVIDRERPRVVIHCAAETRVDYCEENPEKAFEVNKRGTENLAAAVAGIEAKFIYISTDSVFDGRKGNYDERERPNPLNVYAKSKLAGEEAVRERLADFLIVRTNMYGWNARPKSSLAEWILNRLDSGETVPGFTDIHFSPLLVNDLAEILVAMIEADLRGIYHVGARERCSKFDFAKIVSETFEKETNLVRPAGADRAGFKAPRPKDTSLNVGKITRKLNRPMPGIKEGLLRFRQLLEEGFANRLRFGYSREESTP